MTDRFTEKAKEYVTQPSMQTVLSDALRDQEAQIVAALRKRAGRYDSSAEGGGRRAISVGLDDAADFIERGDYEKT